MSSEESNQNTEEVDLDRFDAAAAASDPLPPPEDLLAWYLLSLANKELEENRQLEISDGLKEAAESELQNLSQSGEAQTDLEIDNVKDHLSNYYQGA